MVVGRIRQYKQGKYLHVHVGVLTTFPPEVYPGAGRSHDHPADDFQRPITTPDYCYSAHTGPHKVT